MRFIFSNTIVLIITHLCSNRSMKLHQSITRCHEEFKRNHQMYSIRNSVKPPFSYATMICMAMRENGNKMTLSEIYAWIKENFAYYRMADPSWQVSKFN